MEKAQLFLYCLRRVQRASGADKLARQERTLSTEICLPGNKLPQLKPAWCCERQSIAKEATLNMYIITLWSHQRLAKEKQLKATEYQKSSESHINFVLVVLVHTRQPSASPSPSNSPSTPPSHLPKTKREHTETKAKMRTKMNRKHALCFFGVANAGHVPLWWLCRGIPKSRRRPLRNTKNHRGILRLFAFNPAPAERRRSAFSRLQPESNPNLTPYFGCNRL